MSVSINVPLVDYYAVLGLDNSATADDIRKAYKQKVLETHPDKLPLEASEEEKAEAQERFAHVHEAFQTLGDADERRAYDIHYRDLPNPSINLAPSPSFRSAFTGRSASVRSSATAATARTYPTTSSARVTDWKSITDTQRRRMRERDEWARKAGERAADRRADVSQVVPAAPARSDSTASGTKSVARSDSTASGAKSVARSDSTASGAKSMARSDSTASTAKSVARSDSTASVATVKRASSRASAATVTRANSTASAATVMRASSTASAADVVRANSTASAAVVARTGSVRSHASAFSHGESVSAVSIASRETQLTSRETRLTDFSQEMQLAMQEVHISQEEYAEMVDAMLEELYRLSPEWLERKRRVQQLIASRALGHVAADHKSVQLSSS
ncbi:DnaJ-domain-containing protein [Auriscalpium vulgare]|uniref:DnaJ-domain-containing protein n=1 Tax=Auriscalpium vulgare TaxID=40419 RepID=A0ACB8S3E4_9AGAM|nr:DnaJ-domain-containing protein [Auriscalpium vulgare]